MSLDFLGSAAESSGAGAPRGSAYPPMSAVSEPTHPRPPNPAQRQNRAWSQVRWWRPI